MHRAEAACGLGYSLVCLSVKPVGKPNAGDRHVRFDERGWETERWPQAPSYRAHPRLYRKAAATIADRGGGYGPKAVTRPSIR